MLNNTSRDCDEIRDEFSEFASSVIDALQGYHDHMEERLAEVEQPETEGITIDYKTFSQLVNVLAYGVSVGTVDKKFYDEIVSLGMEQSDEQTTPQNKQSVKTIVINGPEDIAKLFKNLFE